MYRKQVRRRRAVLVLLVVAALILLSTQFSESDSGPLHSMQRAVASVLASGSFDRVLGSLHCLPDLDRFQEPGDLYAHRAPGQVVRDYLAEVARLVTTSDTFAMSGS